MTTYTTISVAADADQDDCLTAAAEAYIAKHPELAGYDLSPRWADEDSRERVLLTIPAPVRINVYRSGGQWFEARWIGDEYDGCDALDVDGDASEAEAMETARTMRLAAAGERTVVRVHDLPLPVVRAEAV